MFSSHTGAPTDRRLLDSDPELFEIHKAQRATNPLLDQAVRTNITVIEEGEKHGVRTYIFTPCIVCKSFPGPSLIRQYDESRSPDAGGSITLTRKCT